MATTVGVAVPMLYTAVAGGEGSLVYTVVDPDEYSSRRERCAPAVQVDAAVWAFDKVCGVPDILRAQLVEGGRLRVHGKATPLGVFYDAFSLD
jgi:hypothetical protein